MVCRPLTVPEVNHHGRESPGDARAFPAALAFYRDRLGFAITFQGLIMLTAIGVGPVPNYTREVKNGWARSDAHLHVPEPDPLAAEFWSRDVAFCNPSLDDDDRLRGASVFDERLEPGQGPVPLRRDRVEMPARLGEPLRVETPAALSALSDPTHETGVFHDAQMFRDRLSSDVEAFGQLRNGQRAHFAQARHQSEARLIAERKEHRRGP